MTNPNAGPWAPPGDPLAGEFARSRQAREREAHAAASAREAIRRDLEASGELEAFIQSKIDERLKESMNG